MITIEQIKQLVVFMRAGQLQTFKTCENDSSISLVLAAANKHADLDTLKQTSLEHVEQADFLLEFTALMHTCGISCIKINDASRQYHLVLAGQPAPVLATPVAAITTAMAVPAGPEVQLLSIYASMTGVFYRAPTPDANPFVAPGQTVTIGDLVCIIESMKMMNPLLSEYTGAIETIHVDNGQTITEGQLLFTLIP